MAGNKPIRVFNFKATTFPNVRNGELQAHKPIEEAGEVYQAWYAWYVKNKASERAHMVQEMCDVATALANLCAACGVTQREIDRAMDGVFRSNLERGRYRQDWDDGSDCGELL